MIRKALIVDDQKINLTIVGAMLKVMGFEVDCCLSGQEAIIRSQERPYDLVLLDIIMPEMDGFEACEKILAHTPDLPVIMLTALADDESLSKSFDAGAIDYIRKPVKRSELQARISNIIKIKDQEERLNSLNSKLLADLNVASSVQAYLVPDWMNFDNGLAVCSLYEPSEKVSGDILDIITISPTRKIVYIGDISGHGVQAALLMTAIAAVIKMIVEAEKHDATPLNILNKLNHVLKNDFFSDNYLTILIGLVDTQSSSFEYCNAGHPPVIEYNPRNGLATLLPDCGAVPLGLVKDYDYSTLVTNRVALGDDSALLLYTDGVYECEDPQGEFLGMEGLAKLVSQAAQPDQLVCLPYLIRQELGRAGFTVVNDDLTMLSISKTMTAPEDELFFKVSPKAHDVARVGQHCDHFLIHHTGDAKLAAQVELVVNETLNNIIRHSLEGTDKDCADIFFRLTLGKDIQIHCWDKGRPWQPPPSLDNDAFDGHDGLNTSGRGVAIIKTIAHDFHIQRNGQLNKTYIRIDRHLHGNSTGERGDTL